MNEAKTLIALDHPLITRGLLHYIYYIVPQPEIEFVDLNFLLQTKNREEKYIIIIDPYIMPDPKQVLLEKIYKNFNQSKLISLSIQEIPLSLSIYFDEKLSILDSEDAFIEKIRCIYQHCGDAQTKEPGNSILSEREKEVLKAVALGHTNKEISRELSISTHTVITHRKNITSKLGIKTIAGLTVYAILNGIIANDELKL